MSTTFGTAECPVCHVTFDRNVPHQVYDKFICSRRASRSRWKARSRTGEQAPTSEAHVAATMNPTDDVLAMHANNFLRDAKTKPVIFHGDFNRTWQPPQGVMFVLEAGGGMIMGHEEAFK